ncbi:hypothetical protein L6164_036417 [Bauhinia variegata]|uniref:Uncharacterized protein n=1 Tax=Bauhinia variegata TaxID=167791 RepID=A0ACB9KH23_BAUVA|nr:hypothetical protein L6164_036417 [Bauhinia variegata]
MRTLGRFCSFIVVHSALDSYQKFLRIFLGFLVMDCAATLKVITHASEIGCGFVLLGSFERILNVLGLFLVLGFSMKMINIGWSSICSMRFVCQYGEKPAICYCIKNGGYDPTMSPCKCGTLKFFRNSKSFVGNETMNPNGMEETDDRVKGVLPEDDEEIDVMTLRKLVKRERQRGNDAFADLEKERMAASSAAEEAMAMILRLQSEKSNVEIRANQYRRMAEQKHEYDEEVIDSLRWLVMEYEGERSELEDQLGLYREKLRNYLGEEEIDQFEGLDGNRGILNFYVEDELDGSSKSPTEC